MTFSEKFNLIMNITNTTNSALARIISIDPSLISRLRRGVRNPAKKENYLKPMAAYFASKCDAQYQEIAIRDVLKKKNLPEDTAQLTELIYQWFLEEKVEGAKSVENFLDGLTQFKFKKTPPISDIDTSYISENTVTNGAVFYGIKGKQAAVINFLSSVLRKKTPTTLLLYSDEDMEWLTESPEFTAKWAELLFKVIMNGNNIKIIHTVNRSLDEILSAIEKWLPIYMTGAIEPYYYPKTRDGVFKRTLFIAPDTAAVTSSSVGNGTKNSANFLFTDKDTIMALTEEYNEYLFFCRPLMRIFTPSRRENYLTVLSEFEDVEGHRILKTDVLSTLTMPIDIADSIYSRLEYDKRDEMLSYHQVRIKRFEDSLKNYKFTEIVTVPDVEAIQSGKVIVNYSQMFAINFMFYTPKEFIRHLQNIIRLLQTFDKYNIHLVTSSEIDGCMIYAKEDVGVFFGKITLPSVLFATNESNMTAAFWEYMRVRLNKLPKGKAQRKTTIDTLSTIIKELNY
jgi:hypothetical protein